jgi:tRNA A37 threonylcarbamoyltransferase TsaD
VSKRGLILGLESSCDETAAAVVERGARTLSSVVASQIATHARYGGVVPELASREHLRAIVPVVRAALAQAGITLGDLDAIAVTSGPGLAGALLVGITYAKALAFAQGLPLIAVNHLEGHIHAVLLHERESPIDCHPEQSNFRQRVTARDEPPAKSRSNEESANSLTGYPRVAGANLLPLSISPRSNPDPIHQAQPINVCHPERAQRDRGPQGQVFVTGVGVEEPALQAEPGAPSIPRPFAEWVGNHEPQSAQAAEPALALVVSGGHTHLYLCRPAHGAWTYSLVGRTLDDAAGEAFDKVAKLLGFGYPGGPWIDALALYGNPRAVPFAFSQIKTKLHLAGKPPRTKAARTAPIANLDPRFLFSFSGIKTAVLRYVELHNLRPEAQARAARLFPPSTICHPEQFPQIYYPEHPQQTCHPEPSQQACHPERSAAESKACPELAEGDLHLACHPEQLPQACHPEPSPQACHPERAQRVEGPAFPASFAPQPPGAPGPSHLGTRETTNPIPPRPPQTKEGALALCPQQTLDLIASFQHAVVGDLMKKTFAAAESLGVRRILITGGVAANRELRARFTAEAARRNQYACHLERSGAKSKDISPKSCHPERAQRVEGPAVALEPVDGDPRWVCSFPTLALSTDNAAMIAAAAWPRYQSGEFADDALSADPSLALG